MQKEGTSWVCRAFVSVFAMFCTSSAGPCRVLWQVAWLQDVRKESGDLVSRVASRVTTVVSSLRSQLIPTP